MKRFLVATSVLFLFLASGGRARAQALPEAREETVAEGAVSTDSALIKPARLPWAYAHVSLGLNMGWMRSDDYKVILDPMKTRPVSLGYTLGLTAGFRNIYQFEFRPRAVSMLNIHYSDESEDVDIEMAVHYRNELLHKVNLLFFKRGDSSGRAPCLFVTYGTSAGGKTRHVDENKDGFIDGDETILGVEFGMISRQVDMTLLVERHQVTFERFRIQGYGEWVGEIDAAFWFVGFRLAGGVGF